MLVFRLQCASYFLRLTTVGGISIVGRALVKLSQNALFTHISVALIQHYKLAVAILRTFLDFYRFSLILRILLI
jgi:hypothetical protein